MGFAKPDGRASPALVEGNGIDGIGTWLILSDLFQKSPALV
jgi:hypothetical protein